MTEETVRALIERAHQHVCALAKGDKRWEMRVPARPSLDSDLLLSEALDAADVIVAQVLIREELEAQGIHVPDGALACFRSGTRYYWELDLWRPPKRAPELDPMGTGPGRTWWPILSRRKTATRNPNSTPAEGATPGAAGDGGESR